MKHIKYFLEFIFIIILFLIFKLIGLKLSRILASYLFVILGPLFRSKKTIYSNISLAFPNSEENLKKNISKKMWQSYGRILAEYIFIKNFRSFNSEKYFSITGQKILDEVKNSNEPVIFVSGHFDNFELMAMHIEKSGINLAAIYRPLNNYFLNPTMENIRKKFICEKQIKKGVSGTKEILNYGRDHTIEESLNHVALWNAAMGISDEMSVAFEAKANNKDPEFDDLIPRTGKKYLDGGYQG